jgi:hypothetical protein
MNESYIKKLEEENKKLTNELQKYKDRFGNLLETLNDQSSNGLNSSVVGTSIGYAVNKNINTVTGNPLTFGPLAGANTFVANPSNHIVFNGDSIEFKSANILMPQNSLEKKIDLILKNIKPKKSKFKRHIIILLRKFKRKFK